MTAMRVRLVARIDRPASPLASWTGVSVVAHAAFVAALVLAPSWRPAVPFPDHPLVVNLVAAAAPPAAVAAPAAPPAEAPPPEGLRIETRAPEPKPLPAEPKSPPKPQPSPPPRQPAPPATASPAPGGVAGAPAGSSIAVLETGDVEFAWYRASVTAALYSHWRRPILEGALDSYEVGIAFEIRRDGSVSNLRIESSSGVPSLDRSALRAVQDAVPLPALPPGWSAAELPARYLFRLLPE